MMYWDGNGAGAGWAVIMAMVMVLFWGGIVTLIWFALRSLQRDTKTGTTAQPGPREILAERLARGDIDPEDFERRLALIGGPR